MPWGFLASHARVLLCIADDPGVRLRNIAARVGITERSAYGIVANLTAVGPARRFRAGRVERCSGSTILVTHRSVSPGRRRGTIESARIHSDQPGECSWAQRLALSGRSSGFSREGTDGA